ncbi:MAG: DNA polymerase III subunit delta [Gemmataceae bacterium]|nr:DNA polymerase III subunit delta [Gemmataceae bacterium]
MDSLAFLAAKTKIGPLYVLHGDEPFLKRQAILAIRERALGADADEQVVSTYSGDKAAYAEVFDELQTAPFFAPRRVVVIEGADPFITKFRPQLEKLLLNLPASGVLILDVKTWASNTRLAKMTPDSATIVCKAPPVYKIAKWCTDWAASRYEKQLAEPAATLLVEFVGGDMGLLDQELEKLSIYVGSKSTIEADDVDRLVGNNRTESTWKIFDALADGQIDTALTILDRQLDQGEEPFKIMGAMAFQVRKLAQGARLALQGTNLRAALAQVGIPPFAVDKAEKHLRRLGREHAAQLYDQLMEANMGLRGGSPLPERIVLERFLLQLARQPATHR